MVGEFWRGEISLRMLRVAVENLPSGSAVHRKARKYEWSQSDELAASAVDQLMVLRWMYASVNREKDTPAPQFPDLFPRPWQAEELERKRAEDAAGEAAARDWFVRNVEAQLNT